MSKTTCLIKASTALVMHNCPTGVQMLRFRLRRLIEEFEFRHKRRLTMTEIGAGTGVSRTTLSRMVGPKHFNTTTDNLNVLCAFFECRIEDLLEFVPDATDLAEVKASSDS